MYLYYKHLENKGQLYWKCRKKGECTAPNSTNKSNSVKNLLIHNWQICQYSKHNHKLHLDKVHDLKIIAGIISIKYKTNEYPKRPPV